MMKSSSLWFVSQTICGKAAVILAKLAPMPMVTKVTGSAQHRSVPREPNKERKVTNFLNIIDF